MRQVLACIYFLVKKVPRFKDGLLTKWWGRALYRSFLHCKQSSGPAFVYIICKMLKEFCFRYFPFKSVNYLYGNKIMARVIIVHSISFKTFEITCMCGSRHFFRFGKGVRGLFKSFYYGIFLWILQQGGGGGGLDPTINPL